MSNTGLLIVDFQNDYFESFEGAKFPLYETETAANNALRLLTHFRNKGLPVFHVQHIFEREGAPFFQAGTVGAEIHPFLTPKEGEPVFVKHVPNSFRGTDLKAELDAKGITKLVIVGAMSNMCIDAATRAATDFGYQCSVAEDACAPARRLELNGVVVEAPQIHAAFMAALNGSYGRVAKTDELLADL